MKNMNLLGKTMVSVAVLAVFGVANAAQNGRASAVGGTSASRMPVMPTVTLNSIGNPAVHTVSNPLGNSSNGIPTPTPTPTPNPNPNPNPNPDPSNCPDGGVANSEYTISMCMDDVLQCVNTGALQGGINDLFNADVRNSIMGGMKLCQSAIDKCIKEVRVDCRNVYAATTDVWLDFNSRVIQPEYYNFVLRKTGLTPNQAENTCLLLDRNTYGESFAAISDTNAVNTEYNQRVGAYNEALNSSLSKNNPQGVKVNTTGYDGNRGHYARWDASKGECLIRVAAYNKDNLITNSWLFGAIGDDTPAEVWQKAGSTFTCNKDLFDFKSLMNQTKTAAVIAVPGGAVLGASIGAAAGAGAYKNKEDKFLCKDEKYLDKLSNYFRSNVDDARQLAAFLKKDNVNDLLNMDEGTCEDLNNLWSLITKYEDAVALCKSSTYGQCFQKCAQTTNSETIYFVKYDLGGNKVTCQMNASCDKDEIEADEAVAKKTLEKCRFHSLREIDTSVYCSGGPSDDCVDSSTIMDQVSQLRRYLRGVEPLLSKAAPKADKGKEIGKGAAIGAAAGAGAGGIATAITALVEKNNINCRVGDGLNTVSLGKSHTIDSLKDFYVKWNLTLPDTVVPTAVVSDVASWQQACSQFNSRLMDCPSVQVNLKKVGDPVYELIFGACSVSGSVCVPNRSTMNSHLITPLPIVNVAQ